MHLVRPGGPIGNRPCPYPSRSPCPWVSGDGTQGTGRRACAGWVQGPAEPLPDPRVAGSLSSPFPPRATQPCRLTLLISSTH